MIVRSAAVRSFLMILLLSFVSLPLGAQSSQLVGEVVSVSDGDTFTLLVGTEQFRVRLNAIDAPESRQSYGTVAREYLASLIHRKPVLVVVLDVDRYERLLCDVYVDTVDVNAEMVRAGYAWHYTHYSSDHTLARLEASARLHGYGLWADPEPVPPWEFRRSAR